MYVKARVTPGAKKERVVRIDDTHFELSVREPARQNMANNRVRELIARECGVPPGKVRLVSGHRSPAKVFDIEATL
jgi:uncharacterized protein YggU (UPF0235/DUF167 family)